MKQKMKRFLKWIGFGLAGVVGLALLALAVVYVLSNARLNKIYDVQPAAVPVPTDETAVNEGKRLYLTRSCIDCHGADGAGTIFLEVPMLGSAGGSNLTAGVGGVAQLYDDGDWVLAIRHGIGPDGKPLLIMPSGEYSEMSDEELGALIAYLKSLPPIDKASPPNLAGPLARIVLVSNVAPVLSAETIDHTAQRPATVAVEPSVEYGRYLVQICMACHGEGLSGGAKPGLPPEPPLPANLTPHMETGLGSWSQEDFFAAMRTGTRPDGSAIDASKMPWPNFQVMTDEELTALWLYLQSVPAQPFGNR